MKNIKCKSIITTTKNNLHNKDNFNIYLNNTSGDGYINNVWPSQLLQTTNHLIALISKSPNYECQ